MAGHQPATGGGFIFDDFWLTWQTKEKKFQPHSILMDGRKNKDIGCSSPDPS
jgi:hypothetical protein